MNKNVLFQFSVINSFLNGVYDGSYTISELKQKGDFGLGTPNGIDGEMIVIDGNFYSIKGDGNAHILEDDVQMPFASVTFFKKDLSFNINKINYKEFQTFIEKELVTKNLFYAIKFTGKFENIKVRTINKQAQPYQAINKVVENNINFEYSNLEGTLVGFKCPYFTREMNIADFHFHFIDKKHQIGGHLFNFENATGTIEIAIINDFQLKLDNSSEFFNVDFTISKEEELRIAEKYQINN